MDERRRFLFVLRCLLAAAGLVVLLLILWSLLELIVLVFGATVLAVLIRALAEPIARAGRLPHRVSVAIAVLLMLGLLAAALWLFGRESEAQFAQLSDALPHAWAAAKERILQLPGGKFLVHSVQGPSGPARMMPSLADVLGRLGSTLADLILLLFGAVFIAADPSLYKAGILKLLPAGRRALAADALGDCDRALKRWLVGQLVSMALVGLLTGLGLWLVGIPSPVALGVIAGLLEIIPYAGPILSAVPGLALALTQSPNEALWALLVYVAVQQIEGNALMPLVQKRAVSLPPALTVFAVVASGMLFGPAGLVFAGPLLVVCFVLVKRLYVREALETPTPIPGETRSEARDGEGSQQVPRGGSKPDGSTSVRID